MLAPSVMIRGLTLSFDNGKRLFENFDLDIDAGKCTCFLGPSGCGKSTLLKLISGSKDLRPTGSITFSPLSAPTSCCALMGQSDLLLPWLNLLDNILLGARLRRQLDREIKEKARKLLISAGLDGYEKTLPAMLSGGMRQRGALLRTLMEGRSVLLMDEPFSALDALTRFKLQNLSAKMTKGATVILVTHDPLEALRMADRIVILGGSPAKVREILSLAGTPPRKPEDKEISENYGILLNKIMKEDRP